jgi:RNA recognition motif-containing protein
MAVSLFVGNLPYNVTEAELRELFSAVGPLSKIYLPTDRETGKLRGFAFLEFNDSGHAQEAIRRFNSELFKGRPLVVNEARAREERPRDSAPSRPSYGSSSFAGPDMTPPPAPGGKPSRSFGPDATPRRKGRSDQKSDRNPKRPLREVERSQFFGSDEDDSFDGDLGEDNFASRVPDEENEDIE